MVNNELFRKHINLRDLGGYKSRDGRHIKPGLLYRSGGIYLMNDEELEAFKSLGIRFIMDLRTKAEWDVHPDPPLPGIHIIRHSGLEFANAGEIDFSPTGMSRIGKEGEEQLMLLQGYYTSIPFDNEAFRILMDHVVKGDAPLVFHCATGKDRTGVFAIILLLALGVDEETVFRDFMLSNYYHEEALEKALAENAYKFKDHPEAKELITMWFGVSEKIGNMVIDSIISKYPSLHDYFLNEFGLNDEDIKALRNLYLE